MRTKIVNLWKRWLTYTRINQKVIIFLDAGQGDHYSIMRKHFVLTSLPRDARVTPSIYIYRRIYGIYHKIAQMVYQTFFLIAFLFHNYNSSCYYWIIVVWRDAMFFLVKILNTTRRDMYVVRVIKYLRCGPPFFIRDTKIWPHTYRNIHRYGSKSGIDQCPTAI